MSDEQDFKIKWDGTFTTTAPMSPPTATETPNGGWVIQTAIDDPAPPEGQSIVQTAITGPNVFTHQTLFVFGDVRWVDRDFAETLSFEEKNFLEDSDIDAVIKLLRRDKELRQQLRTVQRHLRDANRGAEKSARELYRTQEMLAALQAAQPPTPTKEAN